MKQKILNLLKTFIRRGLIVLLLVALFVTSIDFKLDYSNIEEGIIWGWFFFLPLFGFVPIAATSLLMFFISNKYKISNTKLKRDSIFIILSIIFTFIFFHVFIK